MKLLGKTYAVILLDKITLISKWSCASFTLFLTPGILYPLHNSKRLLGDIFIKSDPNFQLFLYLIYSPYISICKLFRNDIKLTTVCLCLNIIDFKQKLFMKPLKYLF